MKILTLINAKRAFSNYLDAKMPTVVAYKIMKLVCAAGQRNEDGSIATKSDGSVPLAKETLMECRQKIDELDSLDVEAPDIHFTLEELSCISITVREMNAISVFISDDGQA